MAGALNYLAGVKAEFKKVTWPTRREALRLTLMVVGGSLLVGLLVGGVDALLLKGLKFMVVG
ncbi:preprotein translocase subunit SecE [Patescibacteria group bacterium]|nr:preprotein translocase subunit SecE [Patescibacteria group bacterium]MBU1970218.1 preprotein translocase subunit SecE [Patescibacteria group bacterium]